MTAKRTRRPVKDKNGRATAKRKRTQKRSTHAAGPSKFATFFLPLVLSVCLAACLIVLGYLGVQRVGASEFFDLQNVSVKGISRSDQAEMIRVATAATELTGVWNADLPEIRSRIEKLPFVKSASVSRVLPGELRVNVVERIPVGIVKLAGGDMLVDQEGVLLAKPGSADESLRVTIKGWDEGKTEKAYRENALRVKLYGDMLADWERAGIVERVEGVDLTDLRVPRAIAQDSGSQVVIDVGRESFSENLRRGMQAIGGKGDLFDSVSLVGSNLRLNSRSNTASVKKSDGK